LTAAGQRHFGLLATAPSVFTIVDGRPACALKDCRPGLFSFGGAIHLKSQYTLNCQVQAYVGESGEVFWGGAHDFATRETLIVQPVRAEPQ